MIDNRIVSRFPILRILFLGCIGFLSIFATNFSMVISYSFLLKKIGVDFLPVFYVIFNLISIVVGFTFFIKNYRGLRELFIISSIMALLFIGISRIISLENAYLIFIVYTLSCLFYIYSEMLFWNFINSTLSIGELKQYTGFIAGMDFSGIILAGVLAKPILSVLSIDSCFLMGGVIYGAASVILYFVSRSLVGKAEKAPVEVQGKGQKKESFFLLFRLLQFDLIKIIVIMTLCMGFLRYFIDFLYGSAISLHFGNSTDVAGFYGIFNAVSLSSVVFFQVFFLNRILKKFSLSDIYRGIGACIMIFALICVAFPGFYVWVLFYFIAVLLSKIGAQPAINLMLKALPADIRDRSRFLVNGVTYCSAVMITGIIIILLKKVGASPFVFSPLVAVMLGALFLFLSGRLNNAYISALLESLRSGGKTRIESAYSGYPVVRNLDDYSVYGGFSDYLSTISITGAERDRSKWRSRESDSIRQLLEKDRDSLKNRLDQIVSGGGELSPSLIRAMGYFKSDELLKNYLISVLSGVTGRDMVLPAIEALAIRGESRLMEYVFPLLNSDDPLIKSTALLSVVKVSDKAEHQESAIRELIRMVRSDDCRFRKMSAVIMGELGLQCFAPALSVLLRDSSPEVQKQAILAIRKTRSTEFIFELRKMLAGDIDRDTRIIIENALSKISNRAMEKILSFSSGLAYQDRQRLANVLNRMEGDFIIRFFPFLVENLSKTGVVNLVEFLVRLDPSSPVFQLLESFMRVEGPALRPLMDYILSGGDSDGSAMKIMEIAGREGSSERACTDLSLALDEMSGERIDRDRLGLIFCMAGSVKLGVENSLMILDNYLKGDTALKEVSLEILNAGAVKGNLEWNLIRILKEYEG